MPLPGVTVGDSILPDDPRVPGNDSAAVTRMARMEREAADRETERCSKLTWEQQEREKRRRKAKAFLAGVLLFGLTVALIQWLFDLPALPAVLFGAILFQGIWIWSVRNDVSELSGKIAETAPDADSTDRSARDGG